LLVIGSIAAVFSTAGSVDDPNEPAVMITPGEEVSRLETQVAEDPTNADAMVILAEVLANSGRGAASIPWFERAISLRADDPQLRIAFGRALQRNGDFFDAEVQFRRALELDGNRQAAAFHLGSLYEQRDNADLDQAREWYQQAIDFDPDTVIAGQARERLATLNGSASPVATP
jgi:cytochrome c-type biogenesis protein CcmH/NrfG